MIEDSLKRITALVRLMKEQEESVTQAEAEAAKKKAELLNTKRVALPELFRELDLQSITLATGEVVSVADQVTASIPATKRAAAIQWLIDRNYDGIVKTTITLSYSRGEHGQADEDAAKIEELIGRPATVDSNVNSQTLKAFVRERMEAGEMIPFDLFGIHPYSEVKVKS